jgi:16S rRNA C1402 (ribose-2'-O) methylase RsmI
MNDNAKTPGSKGKLYLVPAPLDFGCDDAAPLQQVMPQGTLEVAAKLGFWVSENARSTRAYLKRVNELHPLSQPIQALQIQELPREVHKKGDHSGNFDARPLLQAALQGHDMGLVSEAGMPAIADPGSSVVRAAHDLSFAGGAVGGPHVAGDGTGRQWAEWSELCVCRLSAAGRWRALTAHSRARVHRAENWANPDVH